MGKTKVIKSIKCGNCGTELGGSEKCARRVVRKLKNQF